MSKLKLAIQKNGRLSEKSLKLLEECGIKISNGTRKLKAVSSNFPLEILFLRDDDIPQYVEQGVADIGIIGLNEVLEQKKNIEIVQKLGFAQCRLSLAIPKEETYNLTSQIKRSSSSIPTNIAEGCGRFTQNDFANFLQIALGSSHELEYQLLLAKDLEFIQNEKYLELEKLVGEIKAMLISLIKRVRV